MITRLFTAAALLLITFILALIGNYFVLKTFVFFIHTVILWEWLGLLNKNFFQKSLPISIFFLCSAIAFEKNDYDLFISFIINLSVFFWIILVPIILYRGKTFSGVLGLYSAVLITLSSFCASLWALENGLFYFLSILLVVWIADTSAYITGRVLGKKKLAPKISPKKTIEGVYGALFANIVFALICIEFHFGWMEEFKQLTNFFLVFLLVIWATLISVMGDLFQSLLKREAKVKDSGSLLPGHGGFYDRFDAVIAVCPFLMFSVKLVQ